jgi:hypothetical protein
MAELLLLAPTRAAAALAAAAVALLSACDSESAEPPGPPAADVLETRRADPGCTDAYPTRLVLEPATVRLTARLLGVDVCSDLSGTRLRVENGSEVVWSVRSTGAGPAEGRPIEPGAALTSEVGDTGLHLQVDAGATALWQGMDGKAPVAEALAGHCGARLRAAADAVTSLGESGLRSVPDPALRVVEVAGLEQDPEPCGAELPARLREPAVSAAVDDAVRAAAAGLWLSPGRP